MTTQVEGLVVPRLLCIDDDEGFRLSCGRLFQMIFEDAGVDVRLVWAIDAEQGLAHLKDDAPAPRPQGVIVDGLGGHCWEVIDRTAELAIPTILFSGTYKLLEEGERRGILSLLKPQKTEQLEDAFHAVFPFMVPPVTTQ